MRPGPPPYHHHDRSLLTTICCCPCIMLSSICGSFEGCISVLCSPLLHCFGLDRRDYHRPPPPPPHHPHPPPPHHHRF
ncbi:hypothetical protein Ccrd_011588 [Cynara cardunculus var. scolymus]|uniref:Uncharacterized protein n=1 Tax=Cynara cardunculus var. scolymus TaxID=59895 RepID=A0A103YJ01_CYNCS|nr:hypothetical protein Ccrd_011588 [Cynara cardunculus var. scolymus]